MSPRELLEQDARDLKETTYGEEDVGAGGKRRKKRGQRVRRRKNSVNVKKVEGKEKK